MLQYDAHGHAITNGSQIADYNSSAVRIEGRNTGFLCECLSLFSELSNVKHVYPSEIFTLIYVRSAKKRCV